MRIRSRTDGNGQLSLSSLSRLSSFAEPKESSFGRRNRRKVQLEKELEDESEVTLSDESDGKDSASRKNSLSPVQFINSFVTGALKGRGSKPNLQGTAERPSAVSGSTPTQALKAKGKEASIDAPV
jgi:hypothetical protein